MTAPAVETPRRPFVAALAAIEVASALSETAVIGAPVAYLAGAGEPRWAGGPALLVAAVAVWLMSAGRLALGLGPVRAASRAQRAGTALSPEGAAAVAGAIERLRGGNGVFRWVAWLLAALAAGAWLAATGRIAPVAVAGMVAVMAVHASASAAAHGILVERQIEAIGREVLPNLDPMRAFATRYRKQMARTAVAILGGGSGATWALASVLVDLAPATVSRLQVALLVVLVPAALLWLLALGHLVRPIERYLDTAVRAPGTRGPAREDPAAVEAFRVAQVLPYRLGAGLGLGTVAAVGVALAVSRRLAPELSGATALRLYALSALLSLAAALYASILLRDVLRPLIGQLGARHRLPPAEVRSPVGLRLKLVVFFAVFAVFVSGLVALFALAPGGGPAGVLGAALMAIALALGMVTLVVRDLVTPIRALEARSDEMARGELARPVPPAGEADEIGRLTFAFEEMRRQIRDKLRSSESLNVDLEREVRRRTEALEQRNEDLRTALEKLRRAQDDLVRGEKLASMGRLVAGIAHEINNPVNAVINTLGPLEERVKDIAEAKDVGQAAQVAREAQEMLGVIQRGATRTKAIVQALHNYSRGDEETLREVRLERSIDDTVDLLRHRLRGVAVERDVEPGVRVTGFAGQIDQVLMNLVTNAAQAVGGGGTIRIKAHTHGSEVEIAVSDDGPGIPAEVLPRIFDPFFTTKDVGEGSGLGLSIVHGIVERHGGRITVDTGAGQGTTFHVFLPTSAGFAVARPGAGSA